MDITIIKQLIEGKEGIPPDQQRIMFHGMSLADDRTHFTSGRQDFARLPNTATEAIQNILEFKYQDHPKRLSPAKTQNSILQRQYLLSALFNEIKEVYVHDDLPKLKDIVLSKIDDEKEEDDDDDDDDDLSNDQ
ncbi:unnamed protein product [Rotaria socialis]|uniref:Ubiquitin-like domain-containing protein n=1 Tax=Rotaria socialis TaxID=392032 RepID=A0A818BNY4_9BILA|nr:unnamed protein product [Rotaria socialis]CAF4922663.1 unnamed protein product [Rotaria socialis]